MSAEYFEYYTIILRGAVFSWTQLNTAGWPNSIRTIHFQNIISTQPLTVKRYGFHQSVQKSHKTKYSSAILCENVFLTERWERKESASLVLFDKIVNTLPVCEEYTCTHSTHKVVTKFIPDHASM